ncbi:MAG TPA: heavy metal-associated domain-containing protein [Daejeonella sp.]
MISKAILITVVSGLFFATSQMCGCGSCEAKASETHADVRKKEVLRLKLTGITCAGCASHVSKALKSQVGVLEETVEYPGDIAVVKYDPEKTSPEQIIKVIEKAGYKAVTVK